MNERSDFAVWNLGDFDGRCREIIRVGTAFYLSLNSEQRKRMQFQEFDPVACSDSIRGQFRLSDAVTEGEWKSYFERRARKIGVRRCEYCGNEWDGAQCVSCGSRKFKLAVPV